MAHSALKGHRKLRALCRELSITEQLAVGLLQHWWWDVQAIHAVDPDGLLPGWDNRTVAASAGWGGDADRFAQALRTAGFLETDTRNIVVHDWADWAPRFVCRRWEKRGWTKDVNGKWRKGDLGHTQGNPRAPPGNTRHLTVRNPTRPDRTQRVNPGPVDTLTPGEEPRVEQPPETGPESKPEEFDGPDRTERARKDKFRNLFAAKTCVALGLNGAAATAQLRSLYAVARRLYDRGNRDELVDRFLRIAVEKRDAGLEKPIAAWQKEVNQVLGKA